MLEKAIAFSNTRALLLQTVDQKLARGRARFHTNTTTALTSRVDRRIVALLYDQTQIGQVVTLATDVLAKFEPLLEPVREQLQGKTSGTACWSRMDARRPHWPSAINKPTPRGRPFGVTH